MPRDLVSRRYTLIQSDPQQHLESFAEAVAAGLDAETRSLPCRFLYDETGSKLFEEICDLPEYYLTRAERSILAARGDEIAALLPTPTALAELGSGSSVKTRFLIEAFVRRQGALHYVPVDISPSILEDSARKLLAAYEDLEIHAIAGEYRDGLAHVRDVLEQPKLIAWLGSNVGNFSRTAAARFLLDVRNAMSERDRLLIGVDLRKERTVLERAYDDDAGVTARFNLNLLGRVNRELGGNFDLDGFDHRARYREDSGRVEINLVSRRDQWVSIDALDLRLRFSAGESIHTEDSYKYSYAEIDALAGAANLRLERRWLDAHGNFSLNLLAPTPG
jgi:dimethylhistidine N-methyltransferase